MPSTPCTDLDHGPRAFDAAELLRQIGRMNVLAISGGRIERHGNGLRLPVRYGYRVDIFLAANDTYTVRRTHVRSGRATVKAERTDVHAGEVGEAAYRASCYRDAF